jgi:soluble lytic murein transglycosylase-like protein
VQANRAQVRISADQAVAGVNDAALADKSIASLSGSQLDALIKYISRKYLISQDAAMLFVDTAYSAGQDYKVDPLLLLAMMATESRFNPYAGGPRGGATGLLQIVSSVHREKINRFGRGESGVYHPVINTRIGAFILAECIRNRGSVNLGLACYCGATDPAKDGGYTEKVQSERRRMALAATIPVHD